MVESVVRLEQLVETLVQHIVRKGESLAHHSQGKKHDGNRHHHDERPQEESPPTHHLSIVESIDKLEKKVESLTHQLNDIVRNNDSLVRNGHAI